MPKSRKRKSKQTSKWRQTTIPFQRINELITNTKYCGPGTDSSDTPKSATDWACKAHDEQSASTWGFDNEQADSGFVKRLRQTTPKDPWELTVNSAADAFFSTKRMVSNALGFNQEKKSLGKESKMLKRITPSMWNSRNRRRVIDWRRRGVGASRRKFNSFIGSFTGKKKAAVTKRKRTFRGKKRTFRRKRARVAKRDSAYTLASKVLSITSPPAVISGFSYQAFKGTANVTNYFALKADSLSQAVGHMTYDRWKTVYKALTEDTTVANFDNEYTAFWKISKTAYKVLNCGNFPIKVTFLVYKPKQLLNAITDTPLDYLSASVALTGNYPINSVNINTSTPSTLGAATTYWANYISNEYMTPDMLSPYFKDTFSVVRKSVHVLPAGGSFNENLITKPGLKTSQLFDGGSGFYNKYTRFVVLHVESPFLNTNVNDTTCGMPKPGLAVKISTHDEAQVRPQVKPKRFMLIDNSVTGANNAVYVGANGDNFHVSANDTIAGAVLAASN